MSLTLFVKITLLLFDAYQEYYTMLYKKITLAVFAKSLSYFR